MLCALSTLAGCEAVEERRAEAVRKKVDDEAEKARAEELDRLRATAPEAISFANDRVALAAELEAKGEYQEASLNLVGARNKLRPVAAASDEAAALETKLATEIERLDRLSKANDAREQHDDPPKPRDIRDKDYTGYDDAGEPLPLTDEEVAIAIEYGTALFRNAQAGHADERSETKIAKRLAKKHKLRVEVLDGISGRADLLGDRRVLSRIGR